jgi:hypothetical protein
MTLGLAAGAALLFALHAQAADWSRYENSRFGFTFDLSPQFEAIVHADQSDARALSSADGTQVLTISAGSVEPGSFDTEWKAQQASLTDADWALTYAPVPPNWTSFTGTRGARRLYVKMIPLCGGTKQFAMFALEYDSADADAVEPDALRMASSFKHAATGTAC